MAFIAVAQSDVHRQRHGNFIAHELHQLLCLPGQVLRWEFDGAHVDQQSVEWVNTQL